MKNICVFSNFFINDKEKYIRTIDSFKSFEKAKIDKWVINARGRYAKKLKNYLSKKIKKDKFFFSNLDSGNWFEDTKELIKLIDTNLVFFWIEDHVNINSYRYLDKVVKDMIKHKIDYLQYSWYFNGIMLNSFKKFSHKKTKNLIFLNYNSDILNKRRKYYFYNYHEKLFDYIISHQCIITKKLFLKLIFKNKFGFFKKNLPFSFEKNKRDQSWLPYKIGVLKKELFVSIDDDKYLEGYSLISRGLYEDRQNIKKKNIIGEARFNNAARYNLIGQLYFSTFFDFVRTFVKKIIKYY